MKLAVIGSRTLTVNDLQHYLPKDVTEIVSGGAKGIDMCARQYAHTSGLKLTEFIPEYEKYGRRAPLIRNLKIISYADEVIAFWDGKSRGTKYVIDNCKSSNIKITVYKANTVADNDTLMTETVRKPLTPSEGDADR